MGAAPPQPGTPLTPTPIHPQTDWDGSYLTSSSSESARAAVRLHVSDMFVCIQALYAKGPCLEKRLLCMRDCLRMHEKWVFVCTAGHFICVFSQSETWGGVCSWVRSSAMALWEVLPPLLRLKSPISARRADLCPWTPPPPAPFH